jgi:6-phosphofructo-2-kinase/fructose-2,6-biphosphatase
MCFGALEGLPGGKLRDSFPTEFAARAQDPLRYRYPGVGGDSYMDLVTNCRDVVIFLERIQADVAVVCDVAVARVLLGYFGGVPIEQIPNIEIAGGLIELERGHSGFTIVQHHIPEGKGSLLLNAEPPRQSRQQSTATLPEADAATGMTRNAQALSLT